MSLTQKQTDLSCTTFPNDLNSLKQSISRLHAKMNISNKEKPVPKLLVQTSLLTMGPLELKLGEMLLTDAAEYGAVLRSGAILG
mgnify:CR=1 FL=1